MINMKGPEEKNASFSTGESHWLKQKKVAVKITYYSHKGRRKDAIHKNNSENFTEKELFCSVLAVV